MTTTPDNTRIGWIGTGVMGASMCGHLLDAGYPVTLYSRTREKAADLEAAGMEQHIDLAAVYAWQKARVLV